MQRWSSGSRAAAVVGITIAVLFAMTLLAFLIPAAVFASQVSVRYHRQQRDLKQNPQSVSASELHMLTFGTLGPPHDTGAAFGDRLDFMRALYEPHVASFAAFSPKDVPAHATAQVEKCDGRSFPMKAVHCGAAKHGFWLWKPHAIWNHLRTLPENHLLLYTDCNYKKYPEMIRFPERVRETCARILALGGAHHLGAIYPLTGVLNRNSCDPRLLEEEPSLADTTHITISRILVRNSPAGRRFIWDWLTACEQPRMLRPDPVREARLLHMHDQAVFNLVAERHRKAGLLPEGWPGCFGAIYRRFTPEAVVAGAPPRTLIPLIALLVSARKSFSPVLKGGWFGKCEHA